MGDKSSRSQTSRMFAPATAPCCRSLLSMLRLKLASWLLAAGHLQSQTASGAAPDREAAGVSAVHSPAFHSTAGQGVPCRFTSTLPKAVCSSCSHRPRTGL